MAPTTETPLETAEREFNEALASATKPPAVSYLTKHEREAAGYLPSMVTLRILGDLERKAFVAAIEAAGFETYVDCTDALCVCTPAYAKAHRELVQAERAARLDHAKRHAELVRQQGARNRANGYRAPEVKS